MQCGHNNGFGGGDRCGCGHAGSDEGGGGGNRDGQAGGRGLHGVGGDGNDQSARADDDAAFGKELAQAFYGAADAFLRGVFRRAEG